MTLDSTDGHQLPDFFHPLKQQKVNGENFNILTSVDMLKNLTKLENITAKYHSKQYDQNGTHTLQYPVLLRCTS